jgi:hypothetical protein
MEVKTMKTRVGKIARMPNVIQEQTDHCREKRLRLRHLETTVRDGQIKANQAQ